MRSTSSVLDRLRAATATSHHALDSRLNAVDRLETPAGRRELVPRYFRMHAAAEAAAWPWLGGTEELGLPRRSRLPALTSDLEALGLATPIEAPTGLAIGSRAEALGLLYVLEGSTLGGRMIGGAIKARGGDLVGLSFLDPYGAASGGLWRGFLAVLEREAAGDIAGAERGAIAGFRHAEACLLGTERA